MKKLKIPAIQHRMAEIEAPPDKDSREITVSFSSETPYLRYDFQKDRKYMEVLGHDAAEVDLDRLNSGAAPLLKDHVPNLDNKIGTVARAWLEGGRGFALVRFSDTPSGNDILARVRSGDVTCVSVGYGVTQSRKSGTQDGLAVIRVNWQPREISFVAVPADATVGYGRAAENEFVEIEISDLPENKNLNSEKGNSMPKDIQDANDTETKKPSAQVRSDAPIDADQIRADERTRTGDIDALTRQFNLPEEMGQKAKAKGTSADAFRNETLTYLGSADAASTRAGATMIGLSEKEKENFSVVRLLRSLAAPDDRNFRNQAGFELEAVAAASCSHKGQVRGVILPSDITHHDFSAKTRASNQLAGTASLGGNVVDDVLMSGSMIDILRNVSILSQMGVRVFGGLQGDVSFPKQLTDAAAFWVPEDGTPTASGITFGQVRMTPHTCAAMTEISRRLLLQQSVDVEAWARLSIMSSIALKIDAAGLNGDADTDAPNGLSDAAINEVEFAIDDQPTYQETVNMRTQVKEQNALLGNLGYVLSPRLEEHLLVTPRFASGDTPIMVNEGNLGGYKAAATNQSPASEMTFGNWADLYMGLWSGLDLMVDPYTNSASGAVRVVAHQDVDFAIARPQSFTRGKNAQ